MIWQTYMNTRQKKNVCFIAENREGRKLFCFFFDGLLYLFVKKLKTKKGKQRRKFFFDDNVNDNCRVQTRERERTSNLKLNFII